MADGDDDAGLIVIPAMGGNPGALAQFRARAVRRHQQARLDRAAVGQCHIDAVGARGRNRSPRWRAARRPRLRRARPAHRSDWRFSTMCANGSPGSTWPAKVRNTGRVASSSLESVTTMSRIGCAAGSDLVPDPDGIEQPPAGGDDSGRARIAARPHRKRGIGDNDRDVGAKPLAQRQCQRQPRKRAAADDNASLCRHAVPLTRRRS